MVTEVVEAAMVGQVSHLSLVLQVQHTDQVVVVFTVGNMAQQVAVQE